MIKGSTHTSSNIFETIAQATKPERKTAINLSESACQEIADVYFKSSIEMAIASLQSGLSHAKRTNNLKLIGLLERDIETYCDMFNKRELKTFNNQFKAIPFTENEAQNGG